jgi:hypothetical protein
MRMFKRPMKNQAFHLSDDLSIGVVGFNSEWHCINFVNFYTEKTQRC